MKPPRLTAVTCVFVGLILFDWQSALCQSSPSANSTNQSDDFRLIDGLRVRRLFDLAETHCRSVLLSPDLTPTRTAAFTIELIKTQTARAILSTGPDRESAWQNSEQTAAQFLAEHKNHPRAFLVEVQDALSHLSHGQLLRQELAAEMAPESAREQALEQLRQARSLLSEIQRKIVKLIPEHRSRTLDQHELSAEELMTLDNNVSYQLAITNVNRAQLYAADDQLNRIDALNSVLERLIEVQRATAEGQPLWWESQILQVECLRLLGQTEKSRSLLNRLADSVADQPIPPSLAEQQLRLSLTTGDQDSALAGLRVAESINKRTPQLDLARLEVVMHLAGRTTDEQNRNWLTMAAQLTREIEQRHGGYWGRRAELILIGSRSVSSTANNDKTTEDPTVNPMPNPADPNSTELDLLIRLADKALRTDRLEDAVKAYDKAAQTARQLGNSQQAFTLEVRASQALEKQQLHEPAANRLIELANRDTTYELSSAAHLRGCWNWAQTIGSDAAKQKQFVELLNQHLTHWPTAASADQVRIWLGGQSQAAANWKSAFDSYVSVSPDSSLFGDAMIRAVYCANRHLETAEEANRKIAADEFTVRLKSTLGSTQTSSQARHQALLALTEIGIRNGTVDSIELTGPLDQLIAESLDPQEQKRGRAWLLVVLAADPAKSTETSQLLQAIDQDKELLGIADQGLSAIAKHRPGLESDRLKKLRLEVIEKALSTTLDERETTAWLYRKSDALTELGQDETSLAVLADLEKSHPRDAGVQLRIARLMTRVYGTNEPEKPLSKWRQLAAQLQPHSPNWYEAKYQVALLLEASGKKDDARKLLEYLQAIPPGWTESELKGQFERLLAKCKL